MYICIYTHTHISLSIYIYIYIHIYTRIHIYIYVYIYIYVHVVYYTMNKAYAEALQKVVKAKNIAQLVRTSYIYIHIYIYIYMSILSHPRGPQVSSSFMGNYVFCINNIVRTSYIKKYGCYFYRDVSSIVYLQRR